MPFEGVAGPTWGRGARLFEGKLFELVNVVMNSFPLESERHSGFERAEFSPRDGIDVLLPLKIHDVIGFLPLNIYSISLRGGTDPPPSLVIPSELSPNTKFISPRWNSPYKWINLNFPPMMSNHRRL